MRRDNMSVLTASIDEARENLRIIRQTMERSTKYSTLSGLSGILIGIVAIIGVAVTRAMLSRVWLTAHPAFRPETVIVVGWAVAAVVAIGIEFVANKRRAVRVGKHLASPLGAHIIVAALPSFFIGAVLTAFLALHGLIYFIWGAWMICYGLAICAVGLFSVRMVSYLGMAFVLAGAVTLFLPPDVQLTMMAAAFGGFHILYGTVMARRHGW
jgi:hypothetical protein